MQLPAKTACLYPFLLALFYAVFRYRHFSAPDTALFFVSMLAFELSVTGLNNTLDAKKDGVSLPIGRRAAVRILCILWAAALAAAAALVVRTGLVVLACGAVCFFVGVFYSLGVPPLRIPPLSHMPLGELFSGVFEGFFLPFLVVYINAPANSLAGWWYASGRLGAWADLPGLFRLAVLTLPAMLGIAGIMLANNICDAEPDRAVGRRTFPIAAGIPNAKRLFTLLYVTAYADILLTAALRILPPYVLLALLTAPASAHNVRVFNRAPSKTDTFKRSILNLTLLMAPLVLAAGAAMVFA